MKLTETKPPIFVDLFCGGGGESEGLMAAAAGAGLHVELHAINHWEIAIDTHTRNHPGAYHYCDSIQALNPGDVVSGGRVALLWASPECTHHSNARGGRPRSFQSRASAWLILKWLQELYVERVIIENVPEFRSWGPLGADGRAFKSGRGQTYRAWVKALESLGYRVEERVLCAADFGAATTRRRLFVQAVRGPKKICWPQPTHHSGNGNLFGMPGYRSARDVIDWSIVGKSIFGRKRPLADATIRRIEQGIRKYWGEWAEPFLVVLRGTGSSRSPDVPLPAITAGGTHLGLVEPFLTRYNGGENRNHPVSEPLPVIDTSNRYAMVEPSILVEYYGNGGCRPVSDPIPTMATKDRFGLLQGCKATLDIRFRMLQAHELAAATGFPASYLFCGSHADKVKQIGNAVPPPFARALADAYVKEMTA